MNYQMFSLGAVALALVVVSAPALAANDMEGTTHDGKVVSITSGKLVMTGKDGEQHSHALAPEAKVTLDGDACKAADLKAGTRVRVTTKTSDAMVATHVEAIDKNESFENTHDGEVVSITSNKLVMSNEDGQEHSQVILTDAKLTLDGKVCSTEDLKPGTRIRVTTQTSEPNVAVEIEAIEQNEEFADTRDGNVVSIIGDKLVMRGLQEKEDRAYTLTTDANITCDGKACKSSELKRGMRIRVSWENDAPHAATRIEALDKNLQFASL